MLRGIDVETRVFTVASDRERERECFIQKNEVSDEAATIDSEQGKCGWGYWDVNSKVDGAFGHLREYSRGGLMDTSMGRTRVVHDVLQACYKPTLHSQAEIQT